MKEAFRCLASFSFMLFGANLACAQPVSYEQVEEYDLVFLLNRIKVMGEVSSRDLKVRVLSVENHSGSAGMDSGEITYTIYVGVSEYDVFPEQSLFRLQELFNPVFEHMETNVGAPAFHLEHGPTHSREHLRVIAMPHGLDIERL